MPSGKTDTDESDERGQAETCPKCCSRAVHEEFSRGALLGFLTIWPFLPVRRRFSCADCEHSWKRFRW
jgi:hypothetical protein